MDKNLINQLKEKLEQNKKNIEKQLEKFAAKDKKLKDDWDTRFPRFNGREAGGAALEQAADEVEEYSNLLPVEYSLESRLKNINLALEKINPSAKLRVDAEQSRSINPSAKLRVDAEQSRSINPSAKLRVNAEQSRSIKKGKYGICEKCGKEIPIKRLKAFPEAKTCIKCQPST